tara:strand:- start:9 stop:773 length:765 start_codon:yes stop_codon:yes gene_type:complete
MCVGEADFGGAGGNSGVSFDFGPAPDIGFDFSAPSGMFDQPGQGPGQAPSAPSAPSAPAGGGSVGSDLSSLDDIETTPQPPNPVTSFINNAINNAINSVNTPTAAVNTIASIISGAATAAVNPLSAPVSIAGLAGVDLNQPEPTNPVEAAITGLISPMTGTVGLIGAGLNELGEVFDAAGGVPDYDFPGDDEGGKSVSSKGKSSPPGTTASSATDPTTDSAVIGRKSKGKRSTSVGSDSILSSDFGLNTLLGGL